MTRSKYLPGTTAVGIVLSAGLVILLSGVSGPAFAKRAVDQDECPPGVNCEVRPNHDSVDKGDGERGDDRDDTSGDDTDSDNTDDTGGDVFDGSPE